MENSKQPINPVQLQQVSADEYRGVRINDPKEYTKQFNGLTKREYFAGLAMQGIDFGDGSAYSDNQIKSACKTAIKFADELLKQLEKYTNGKDNNL